jgi:hypothetical protein
MNRLDIKIIPGTANYNNINLERSGYDGSKA